MAKGSRGGKRVNNRKPSRDQLEPLGDKVATIQQIEKDIGSDRDTASRTSDAIMGWTKYDYPYIRDVTNDEYKSKRELIENYIDKSPTYNGDIYRGINLERSKENEAFVNSLQNGAVIDMRGISSWSNDIRVAKHFAVMSSGETHVLFKCKNKTGVGIKHLSNYANESEVLQSSKSKFKVKNFEIDSKEHFKYYVIELEEV